MFLEMFDVLPVLDMDHSVYCWIWKNETTAEFCSHL